MAVVVDRSMCSAPDNNFYAFSGLLSLNLIYIRILYKLSETWRSCGGKMTSSCSNSQNRKQKIDTYAIIISLLDDLYYDLYSLLGNFIQ